MKTEVVWSGHLHRGLASEEWVTKEIETYLKGLDWQKSVQELLATPPVSPNEGDRYLIIAAATGDWTGKEDHIAEWDGDEWKFTEPNKGFAVTVEGERTAYIYVDTPASGWIVFGSIIEADTLLSTGTDADKGLLADGTDGTKWDYPDHATLRNRAWNVAGHTINTSITTDKPLNPDTESHGFFMVATDVSDDTLVGGFLVTENGGLLLYAPDSGTGGQKALLKLTDGTLEPTTTNEMDLGTATHKYKDLYLEGDITVGGDVDGVDISDHASDEDAHHDKAHALTHEITGDDEITIENLKTDETTTTKILQPNGTGGIGWEDLPTPLVNHDDLNNLDWSDADHVIDEDIDMLDNGFVNVARQPDVAWVSEAHGDDTIADGTPLNPYEHLQDAINDGHPLIYLDASCTSSDPLIIPDGYMGRIVGFNIGFVVIGGLSWASGSSMVSDVILENMAVVGVNGEHAHTGSVLTLVNTVIITTISNVGDIDLIGNMGYISQTGLNNFNSSKGLFLEPTDRKRIINIDDPVDLQDVATKNYVDGEFNGHIKSGVVADGSFTGTPKIYALTFATTMGTANYSVAISSPDSRSWTIESKSATGFTINSNSDTALTGEVMWTIILHKDA